jgi:hypothetical protein
MSMVFRNGALLVMDFQKDGTPARSACPRAIEGARAVTACV